MVPCPPASQLPGALRSICRLIRVGGAVFALALVGRPASGQAPAAAAIPAEGQEWRWVRFGPETGIPSGRLIEVLESNGTTWVATDLGVGWFDGYRWHRVAPELGPGTGPRRLVPDGHGGAWAVVNSRPVHLARTGMTTVPMAGPAAQGHTRWLAPIDSTTLLVLADSTLYRLDPVSGGTDAELVPPALARLLALSATRLLRTRPGHLWLITPEGVWLRGDDGWSRWFDRPTSIFRETEAGGILSTGSSGSELYQWRPGGRPEALSLPGMAISALSLAPSGEALIVFWEGRAAVRHAGSWRWLDPMPEPLEWSRQIVHRDNGDYWAIGPRGLFLFRASGRRWTHYRIPGRDEFTGFVNTILRARSGELWLGTERGLVRQLAAGRPIEATSIADQPLGAVTALAQDTAGGIWVGSGATFVGAFRFDGRSWRHYGPADGLDAPRIHRIVTTRGGSVWFLGLDSTAAGGPGAFRWDGRRFARIGPDQLGGGRVYDLAEGPDGALWFGTDAGLSRLQDGQWTHWPATPAGVGARIYSVAVDSSGGVWFCHRFYGLGLGHLTPSGRIERVDLGEDRPANEVSEVRIGPDGSVWFTTHAGLGQLRGDTVSFFDRSSGLDNPRLWPLLPLRDRVLAGGEGLFQLDLAEASFPAPAVDVATPLPYPDEVLLRWTPLAYWGTTPTDRIETRYRLDGGDWSGWSLTRQISLFRLSPGAHRVEVEGKGLFGQIGAHPAAATFSVPSPWYRRAPVVIAILLGGAAVVGLAIAYLRRLRLHHAELERLNRALAADVEERRRTERALEESRLAVQRIADSVPSVLLQFELASGRLIYANREVERLLGYPPDELVGGLTWEALVDGSERTSAAEYLDRLQRAADGEIVEGELQLRSASRAARTVAVRSAVFTRSADGRPETVLLIGQDVSEQRHLEAQLVQAQKMETVGRLAGGVAHDFNNILTAIIGYAELARQTAGPDEATRGDLDEITRAAERARTLTSQLLTFARRQVVETRPVDLNRLVTDVDRMLRRLIGADIELVTVLADQVPIIRADPAQLEQVLMNLAVNARDAMTGGGRLTITTASAERWDGVGPGGERITGPCVLLTVADTGHGMAPGIASRIFEPFFTTKAPGHGTGLGLSTCYGMIRQAGGVVTVESEPESGSTFVVAFPRVDEPSVEPARPTPTTTPERGSETVLLVEDETQVRTLSSRILRQAGYLVVEASNGRHALEVHASLGRAPDLLLTDVVMPEMGGPSSGRCSASASPRSRCCSSRDTPRAPW